MGEDPEDFNRKGAKAAKGEVEISERPAGQIAENPSIAELPSLCVLGAFAVHLSE